MSAFVVQILNGLASASTLFLVAAGLSLIFGVTRIVNFAHGSLFMLGVYIAYTFIEKGIGGAPGFWMGVVGAAIAVAVIGALMEILLLRRIYQAPELFQLLGTFGLTLIIKDVCLYVWGAEDLLGPRAPGLKGSVDILGRAFPEYDLLLIAIGPVILGALWLLLNRTRWGTLVRAATLDREMVGALGVNQKWLFTGVFALGAGLAGLGGALQIPREPAQLFLDVQAVSDAFVVVVVGGLGSIPGAFLAAILIGVIKAICIGIGNVDMFGTTVSFSKLTLVVEFIVMAIVLVVRPWGLLGKQQAVQRAAATHIEAPLRPGPRWLTVAALALLAVLFVLPAIGTPYTLVLMIDILAFALFAASLHFIMGPGGMASFGHAAYFGLGAYGAGLLLKAANWSMTPALIAAPIVAGIGAILFGWFCVRLSGVYLAMLTLAFAQIAWSVVFQWDAFTGGSNGLVGIWPEAWASSKTVYYYVTLIVCVLCLYAMRRMLFAPFGYALRAGRDSPLRADAIGINVPRIQWAAFVVVGAFAGVAGGLYAFSKGSISPEVMAVTRSIDGLVMVLLGGVQTLTGPIVGAAVLTWLQDTIARNTDYWRAMLGIAIVVIVLAFPQGIVGALQRFVRRGEAA